MNSIIALGTLLCYFTLFAADMPEWKKNISQQFSEYTMYLENIVQQGEMPDQKAAITQEFITQKNWVYETLDKAQKETDKEFIRVSAKANNLKRIVDLHKDVSERLNDRFKTMVLRTPNVERMQLMLLYEINSRLHKKDPAFSQPNVSAPDKDALVDSVLKQSLLQYKLPLLPMKDLQSFFEQLDNATLSLRNLQVDYKALKNECVVHIETLNKKNLEQEAIILDMHQQLDRSEQQRADETEKANLLNELLERQKREFDVRQTGPADYVNRETPHLLEAARNQELANKAILENELTMRMQAYAQ